MEGSIGTYLEHVQFAGVETTGGGHGRARLAVTANRAMSSRRQRIPAAAEEERAAPLADWLLQQAGLDANAYRRTPLLRRMPACLRHLRVQCPDAARALLDRKPHLVSSALNVLLIGVTEFFRDEPVFQQLRDEVVPSLLRTRPVVRIYSAGASSGEELYSVAILFAEMGALDRCQLLGLDCRDDAMAQARRGTFRAETLASLEPRLRDRYFRREGPAWIIDDALRSRAEWRTGDLLGFSEPQPHDLILFRNVAIYLAQAHVTAAWARLAAQLAPGGFLITGRAEQPPPSSQLRRIAPSIYRHT